MTDPCPRCGAPADQVEQIAVPRPLTPGDPLGVRCKVCGQTTWLDNATGEWQLPDA